MSLNSYELTRRYSYSNPRKEMLREKEIQIHNLYEFAVDREDDAKINGNSFIKSPRVFDRKFVDTIHHKITVETILQDDWMECGDYLEYDGMIWLCLNSYSFHKLYCRATFMSCDWKIYWINEDGEIRSQYVIDQNSTQYNSGESGNSTTTLGAAQHMLKMQCNDDTVILDSPQRFAIDKNIKRPTCYKITQNDNTVYNYGKGLCCITVTETQLDLNKDKLITLPNGTKVWICDYNNSSSIPYPDTTKYSIKIEYSGNPTVVAGSKGKVFTAKIFDASGDEVEGPVIWQLTCLTENEDYVSYEILGNNSINIKSKYSQNIIGTKVLLQAIYKNKTEQIYITIGGGI